MRIILLNQAKITSNNKYKFPLSVQQNHFFAQAPQKDFVEMIKRVQCLDKVVGQEEIKKQSQSLGKPLKMVVLTKNTAKSKQARPSAKETAKNDKNLCSMRHGHSSQHRKLNVTSSAKNINKQKFFFMDNGEQSTKPNSCINPQYGMEVGMVEQAVQSKKPIKQVSSDISHSQRSEKDMCIHLNKKDKQNPDSKQTVRFIEMTSKNSVSKDLLTRRMQRQKAQANTQQKSLQLHFQNQYKNFKKEKIRSLKGVPSPSAHKAPQIMKSDILSRNNPSQKRKNLTALALDLTGILDDVSQHRRSSQNSIEPVHSWSSPYIQHQEEWSGVQKPQYNENSGTPVNKLKNI